MYYLLPIDLDNEIKKSYVEYTSEDLNLRIHNLKLCVGSLIRINFDY